MAVNIKTIKPGQYLRQTYAVSPWEMSPFVQVTRIKDDIIYHKHIVPKTRQLSPIESSSIVQHFTELSLEDMMRFL